jgi:hypothetical protein
LGRDLGCFLALVERKKYEGILETWTGSPEETGLGLRK